MNDVQKDRTFEDATARYAEVSGRFERRVRPAILLVVLLPQVLLALAAVLVSSGPGLAGTGVGLVVLTLASAVAWWRPAGWASIVIVVWLLLMSLVDPLTRWEVFTHNYSTFEYVASAIGLLSAVGYVVCLAPGWMGVRRARMEALEASIDRRYANADRQAAARRGRTTLGSDESTSADRG